MLELSKIHTGDARVMHGDCLEVMRDIPAGSVDMVLADLPYGNTIHVWDSMIPLEPLWEQYRRVVKPSAAIVLFAVQPFASVLVCSNLRDFRYEWAWKKTMATLFQHANHRPMRIHENVLVFYQQQPTYNPQFGKREKPYTKMNGDRKVSGFHASAIKHTPKINRETIHPVDVVEFANPNRHRLHPTEKPTDMLEYFIRTYTNEGELVLDNCMGSGSTGEACMNTNRRFIGIEKDPEIFSVAVRRLNGELGPLFEPARAAVEG